MEVLHYDILLQRLEINPEQVFLELTGFDLGRVQRIAANEGIYRATSTFYYIYFLKYIEGLVPDMDLAVRIRHVEDARRRRLQENIRDPAARYHGDDMEENAEQFGLNLQDPFPRNLRFDFNDQNFPRANNRRHFRGEFGNDEDDEDEPMRHFNQPQIQFAHNGAQPNHPLALRADMQNMLHIDQQREHRQLDEEARIAAFFEPAPDRVPDGAHIQNEPHPAVVPFHQPEWNFNANGAQQMQMRAFGNQQIVGPQGMNNFQPILQNGPFLGLNNFQPIWNNGWQQFPRADDRQPAQLFQVRADIQQHLLFGNFERPAFQPRNERHQPAFDDAHGNAMEPPVDEEGANLVPFIPHALLVNNFQPNNWQLIPPGLFHPGARMGEEAPMAHEVAAPNMHAGQLDIAGNPVGPPLPVQHAQPLVHRNPVTPPPVAQVAQPAIGHNPAVQQQPAQVAQPAINRNPPVAPRNPVEGAAAVVDDYIPLAPQRPAEMAEAVINRNPPVLQRPADVLIHRPVARRPAQVAQAAVERNPPALNRPADVLIHRPVARRPAQAAHPAVERNPPAPQRAAQTAQPLVERNQPIPQRTVQVADPVVDHQPPTVRPATSATQQLVHRDPPVLQPTTSDAGPVPRRNPTRRARLRNIRHDHDYFAPKRARPSSE